MEQKGIKKTFFKNYFRLHQLVWSGSKGKPNPFLTDIKHLRLQFGIDSTLEVTDLAGNEFNKDRDSILRQSDKKIEEFLLRLIKKDGLKFVEKFYKAIEDLRVKYKLGEEWQVNLRRIVVAGTFYPPILAMTVRFDEKRRSFHFIVGPDTSKEELDMAWKMTDDWRKEEFGRSKAFFPTKKSIQNMSQFIKFREGQTFESNTKDEVTKRRYQRKGLDIISDLYPEEKDISEKADRRRLAKLKTFKSRLKK